MALTTALQSSEYANDYRLGFRSLEQELPPTTLGVDGALPDWLRGSLLRTGPAKFEVGEQKLRHWFDGLAMLHNFSFDGGEVTYTNRFLHSKAYRAAKEKGEIVYSEFATDPCRSLFKRVQSLFSPAITDNCNVNITKLGEQYVAMTETPMPIAFDPATLEAAGVAYRPPGQLTIAHPHAGKHGELVSYAVRFGPRTSYRVYTEDASATQAVIAKLPVSRPAYMHSFGITERLVVLAEFPLVVNPVSIPLSGRPFIENYAWEPERGTRFLVIDRESGELRGSYEGDAFFCFHHVNAWEQDGELIVDLVAYEDAEIVKCLYLDRLRDRGGLPESRLQRCRIGLDDGRVQYETLSEVSLELPRINYRRCNAKTYSYVYGTGTHGGESDFFNEIVKLDVSNGASTTWRQSDCYPGEPVFVAAPEAQAEDEGVLLSVVLDAGRQSSFLLVLDAADLRELARSHVPHHIPFGFHGQYYGSLS